MNAILRKANGGWVTCEIKRGTFTEIYVKSDKNSRGVRRELEVSAVIQTVDGEFFLRGKRNKLGLSTRVLLCSRGEGGALFLDANHGFSTTIEKGQEVVIAIQSDMRSIIRGRAIAVEKSSFELSLPEDVSR